MTSEFKPFHHRQFRWQLSLCSLVVGCLFVSGCAWPMLDRTALKDPVAAVDGNGQVFESTASREISGGDVSQATDSELLAFYAPVYVQQYKSASEKGYAYEHEVDLFGTPFLERLPNGKLQTRIDPDQPTVYGIIDRRQIGERNHVQLTYTIWYRRHPRTKRFDIEPGLIDSGVVRITLDDANRPLIYETVLACGCYHKVFVETRLEDACRESFGPPEDGKEYSISKPIPFRFDFEVAGLVDTPEDAPAAPVIFISSGDHKVLGLHSSATLNRPQRDGAVASYRLADYRELEALQVVQEGRTQSMFNSANDQQVLGAQRMERFIFAAFGTDDAGHPRRNEQILLHFDQSKWIDPNLFFKYLRLPPGTM